jgi:hypothetical protein
MLRLALKAELFFFLAKSEGQKGVNGEVGVLAFLQMSSVYYVCTSYVSRIRLTHFAILRSTRP